ncbi:PspA/IM30 family protein [Pseudomonas sp. 21LCFQ010]|uniref:PspA/IM30 family protein n=1 Tax=Pseudomonas sp. 21LCFQ010 TaxID=2957506 RepID=UPI0020970BD9|nr:PspA/IM30 family protein [Pseudomonas sp. 21LCFQ010]MCO8162133.1 PspA/IM30 family protein [Pseudomonas sp. 21LCFQ010]
MGRIWTKLLIALRGGANDTAEAVMARQALRILDQEICAAEEQVGVGRSNFANLMTKQILAAREAEQTREQLNERTRVVGNALATGDKNLAMDVAGQVGRLELLLIEDTRIANEYARSVDNLRQALEMNESKLRALKKQIELLRDTDFVQQAQTSLSTSRREPAARLQVVADTLDSIRQQQQETAAQLQAEEMLCLRDQDLERRLRDASVIYDRSSASAVLERIKAGAGFQVS